MLQYYNKYDIIVPDSLYRIDNANTSPSKKKKKKNQMFFDYVVFDIIISLPLSDCCALPSLLWASMFNSVAPEASELSWHKTSLIEHNESSPIKAKGHFLLFLLLPLKLTRKYHNMVYYSVFLDNDTLKLR